MPTQDLPKTNFEWADKIIHISIHLLLASLWLFYVNSKNSKAARLGKKIAIVLLLCVVYGIIIEILQQVFTTSRRADVFDVCANTIGTFLGLSLFWTIKNIFKI